MLDLGWDGEAHACQLTNLSQEGDQTITVVHMELAIFVAQLHQTTICLQTEKDSKRKTGVDCLWFMHLKDPVRSFEKSRGISLVPGFQFWLITGPQWCPTTLTRITQDENHIRNLIRIQSKILSRILVRFLLKILNRKMASESDQNPIGNLIRNLSRILEDDNMSKKT
jgi:hypothetical protein